MNSSAQDEQREERIGRILDAALEVFSECSFQDATTGEIARRARVSKRDIYAHFPQKHILLFSTVARVMRTHDEEFERCVGMARTEPSLDRRLRRVSTYLVEEIFSPNMSVVTRLITSEGISQPMVGTLFFEGGLGRRRTIMAELLSDALPEASPAAGIPNTEAAADTLLSLVCYVPSMAALAGMHGRWDSEYREQHVGGAIDSFLRSHTEFDAEYSGQLRGQA